MGEGTRSVKHLQLKWIHHLKLTALHTLFHESLYTLYKNLFKLFANEEMEFQGVYKLVQGTQLVSSRAKIRAQVGVNPNLLPPHAVLTAGHMYLELPKKQKTSR